MLGDLDRALPRRRASRDTSRCSGRMPTVSRAELRRAARRSTKFIFGEPMKPATNRLSGRAVELERRADLLDLAGVQHHDLVGHGHRLDLVVGDVDRGGAEAVLQPRDLQPHVDAQRRVEIGERLVEEERLRLAHDGAADGDALALAAGERARPAVEIGREVEERRRLLDLPVALRLRRRRPCAARSRYCCAPSCADRARRTGTPSRGRASPAAGR